jgi:hypothetical protein
VGLELVLVVVLGGIERINIRLAGLLRACDCPQRQTLLTARSYEVEHDDENDY